MNYRHLYYFWVVAKEGGFARAAKRLDMALQTVSTQVRELEKALGYQLLKPDGRGVTMTDAGQAAFSRADEIFQLGQMIPEQVREAASGKVARLAIGMTDGISKLALQALLEPVLATSSLRLVCHEGELEELMAELSLHRLDLVLAGHAAPRIPNLRLTTERLAQSPVAWYGSSAHVGQADVDQFPESLNRLPVLLPTAHSALRGKVDQWFDANGLRPRVVGEFEDSGLLAVFAARGLGVFPVSRIGAGDAGWMHGLTLLGRCDDVTEEIHAIRSHRGQHHPLALQIIEAARMSSRSDSAFSELNAP